MTKRIFSGNSFYSKFVFTLLNDLKVSFYGGIFLKKR